MSGVDHTKCWAKNLTPSWPELGYRARGTWRLSNGALGLLGLAAVAAFIARSRLTSTTTGQRVLLVLSVLTIGAHFLASGGVLTQYALIFVLGLILALVVAAYNFLLLLFSVERAA